MSTNGQPYLATFRYLERVAPSIPALGRLEDEIHQTISSLGLPPEKLKGKRIAVSAGSRGVANLREIVRAVCQWLKNQGAQPFVFAAMGSHGGGTPEGQRAILEGYGVTPDFVGAQVLTDMETAEVGETPEGFKAFMDRNAWQSDGVVVLNRIKTHTDFSGKIESGLSKMMAVGMGKIDGASQVHRGGRRHGLEVMIRALSRRVLASGKILCGLAVVENEFHQVCAVHALRPENIPSQEEEILKEAAAIVPRIPFSKLDLLIVDEIGKNISGAGMDTKTIGRGVNLLPEQGPDIRLIYIRDLTPETAGNAVGVALADLIHSRVSKKIDTQKTFLNIRTALNPRMGKIPMPSPSDREALQFLLGALGTPTPEEQRIVWIRNTQTLNRIAIAEAMSHNLAELTGWRLAQESFLPKFDGEGNIPSPFGAP